MEALGKSLGRVPQLRVPQRGRGVKWIELAQENAHNALRMRRAQAELAAEGRKILARVLQLPAPPERVECFDVSHTAGEGTVASCVVFGPDGAHKRDYRRYNIEGVTAGDDYGAMHQALRRHGARIAGGERTRPDLLLIDGGPGQVDAAVYGAGRGGGRRPAGGGSVQGRGPAPGPGAAASAGRPDPRDSRGRQRGAAFHPARAR